jgi:hypothetical protein
MLNSEAKCTSTHNGTLMRTRPLRFNTTHLERLIRTCMSASLTAPTCAALFTRELVTGHGHRACAMPVSSYRYTS